MATTNAFSLASPPLARICLYGDLQRFGRRISLYVNTAAEAIRALSLQVPGFRRQMNEGWYRVRIAGEDTSPEQIMTRLHEPLSHGDIIHLIPRTEGAKSGGVFQAVLGAALVVASIWMPGIGIAASNIMFSMGAAMALGGVAQLLAPKAKTPDYRATDNGKQNTYFSSLDNMIAQGNPMPV
ncbi:TPA: tail assembly protein, partial [Escherichia coli]|nr:tail assembly protein [Escherichia coli]HBA8710500.1 tail assembly protein [Escherichia coli]